MCAEHMQFVCWMWLGCAWWVSWGGLSSFKAGKNHYTHQPHFVYDTEVSSEVFGLVSVSWLVNLFPNHVKTEVRLVPAVTTKQPPSPTLNSDTQSKESFPVQAMKNSALGITAWPQILFCECWEKHLPSNMWAIQRLMWFHIILTLPVRCDTCSAKIDFGSH